MLWRVGDNLQGCNQTVKQKCLWHCEGTRLLVVAYLQSLETSIQALRGIEAYCSLGCLTQYHVRHVVATRGLRQDRVLFRVKSHLAIRRLAALLSPHSVNPASPVEGSMVPYSITCTSAVYLSDGDIQSSASGKYKQELVYSRHRRNDC